MDNKSNDDELLAALLAGQPTIVDPTKQKPPPAATVTRINFGSIKEKPKATAKSEYPELPDADGSAAKLAEEFLKQHAAEAKAKGAKEIARGQLVELATPFHWRFNSCKAEVAGTVSVKSETGKEVLVQFKDAYKAITDLKDKNGVVTKTAESRVAALPPEVFATYFKQSFVLEIKSDLIPEEKLQAVVDKIQAVAIELGITEAVQVSACFKPVPSFHTDRYSKLTADQNMAIEKSMGEKGLMTIAVTAARGRTK